jgi:hypothetical protein
MAVSATPLGIREHAHAIVKRRPEVMLVRCAIGLVVLYVLVDSFLAPEPGSRSGV